MDFIVVPNFFSIQNILERNFIIQTFVSKIKEMGHGNSK